MATATTARQQGRRVGRGTPPAPGRQFGFGLVANTLLGYTLAKGLQLTLYNLIFPLYAYSLGYDQETIGRLNATGALMVLLCSVPLGMLADRIGRARLLTISAFLSPLALLGIAFSTALPALVICLLLQNAISVVYWSATSPLLIGTVSEERRVTPSSSGVSGPSGACSAASSPWRRRAPSAWGRIIPPPSVPR